MSAGPSRSSAHRSATTVMGRPRELARTPWPASRRTGSHTGRWSPGWRGPSSHGGRVRRCRRWRARCRKCAGAGADGPERRSRQLLGSAPPGTRRSHREVVALAQVRGPPRGDPEGLCGTERVTGLLEEVRPHGVQAMGVEVEAVEQLQPGVRALDHRDGDRPIEGHDRVAGHPLEQPVERRDLGPPGLHDEAPSHAQTRWAEIASLYGLLERMTGNPVVTLNRAVAVAMVEGPDTGLKLLDSLDLDTHRLYAVRAHLLEESGDPLGAAEAFRVAAGRATNLRERDYLTMRAARAGRG